MYSSLSIFIILLSYTSYANENKSEEEQTSIYDININALSGEALKLGDYKGKYILFVNVASECGYTPQYEGLVQLQNKYQSKLVIIGVPCNQFGEQEPGSAEQIQQFCDSRFHVNFTLTEKINVKDEQHPLYKWLTQESLNGVSDFQVKWNFHKILVSPEGKWIAGFPSKTKPMSEEITAAIQ